MNTSKLTHLSYEYGKDSSSYIPNQEALSRESHQVLTTVDDFFRSADESHTKICQDLHEHINNSGIYIQSFDILNLI